MPSILVIFLYIVLILIYSLTSLLFGFQLASISILFSQIVIQLFNTLSVIVGYINISKLPLTQFTRILYTVLNWILPGFGFITTIEWF